MARPNYRGQGTTGGQSQRSVLSKRPGKDGPKFAGEESMTATLGISILQLEILRLIYQRHLTVQQLVSILNIKQRTLYVHLCRMRAKGLCGEVPRRGCVQLSEKGLQLAEEIREKWSQKEL
jgi:DNA-binding MarR family transcriptional regulator